MPQSAIDPSSVEGNSSLTVQPQDVAQMASDLFSAMLNMPFDSTPRADVTHSDNSLEASIRIEGDWQAEIRVIAGEQLAQRIASAMFATEVDTLQNDEIRDAMGEVVNVIGGNVKGVIDQNCSLSLPHVGCPNPELPGHAISLTFTCDGSPLTVVLIHN